MKRLTHCLLPISVDGLDLGNIEKMRFLFVQNGKRLIFDYPSDRVVQDADGFLLKWTPEETALFVSDRDVNMDTLIKLVNIDQNPQTGIVRFTMSPTLFREEELFGHD